MQTGTRYLTIRLRPPSLQLLLAIHPRKLFKLNQHIMKILMGALLCSSIFAVCASESNSSLLESKADDAGASSSGTECPRPVLMWMQNVMTIYKKVRVDAEPEIFISATLVTPQACITNSILAFDIITKLANPNLDYPEYGAINHDAITGRTKDLYLIEAVKFFDKKSLRITESYQILALLALQKPLPELNISNMEGYAVVYYEYGYNMEVYTYGNYVGNSPIKKGSIRKMILVEKFKGFAVHPNEEKHYSIFHGAPLIYDDMVVGVDNGWGYSDLDSRPDHKKEQIHAFIFFYNY